MWDFRLICEMSENNLTCMIRYTHLLQTRTKDDKHEQDHIYIYAYGTMNKEIRAKHCAYDIMSMYMYAWLG